MRRTFILLFIFFGFKLSTSFAQIDTLFYFAPPWVTPDHNPKQPIKFHISSFSVPQTTVHMMQPASPFSMDTTFVMGPGQLVDITYWRGALASATSLGYDSLETRPADVVRTNGVRIRSTSKITVVYDEITVTPNNPETYSLKGQNAFGTEFICPFQTKWDNVYLVPPRDNNGDGITTQPKSQINIVATKPNTVVWITPRCPVVGVNGTRPANVTYSISLPVEGACYTVENVTRFTSVPGQNLSGSIVISDKPIAVTVSDDSVNPGSAPGQTCYDLMGDQIVPVELVGTDYIVNRGQLNAQTGEAFFIVATENFTKVEIVGASTNTFLLNKGDTYTHNMDNNLTYVKSDKNVYMLSASGYGCELGEAILPPLNCAGSDSVTFTRNNADAFFLNVLCKTAAISSFSLVNSAGTTTFAASDFTAIPATATLQGGPYYGAQLGPFATSVIPVNSSNLLFNSSGVNGFFAMGVFNGTTNGGTLFHYMSSFLRRTVVKTETLSPICSGQAGTVAVTGTITGADVGGVWSTSYHNGSTMISGGATGSFPTLTSSYTSSLNIISTVYTVSPNDTTSTAPTKTITLYLSSFGSCKSVTDSVKLVINQRPRVTVGTGTVMCKNNISPVLLSGTVTNGFGQWGGGNGGVFGVPGLVTTYTPSPADLAANTITLDLTSVAPLPGCLNTVSSLTVGFTNPPVVTIVPNNAVVCTNSSSLALNGSVTGALSGSWAGGTGAYTLTNSSPTATYLLSPNDLTQPSITLTLSSTGNGICAAETATMQIDVIDKPVLSLPSNYTVCEGSLTTLLTGSITLNGAPYPGLWTSTMANGAFSNQQAQTSPINTTYSLSALDTNYVNFILESAPGICPVVQDSFSVFILAAPVVNVNSSFLPVCKNAEIALTGTITGYTTTGLWSTSSQTSSPGTFTPAANFLNSFYQPSEADIQNGFVELTLTTTGNQCPPSSAAFTASFVPSPTARFSFSPKRCLNTPLLFNDASTANGTAFLKWSWDFGDNSQTGGSSAPNPIKTYTVAQQYVVTLTVTGVSLLNVECPDVWDTVIKIKPLPLADFDVSAACQEFPVIFTNRSLAPPGSDPITNWKWEFGDSIQFNVPPLFTGVPTTTVNHAYGSAERFSAYLTVTATPAGLSPSLGCVSDPHREYVDVFAKPNAEFGLTNNPSVVEEPVYFSDFSTPTSNIAQWFWEFGDDGASTDQAPVHTYQKAGIFSIKLTVTDFAGCKDTIRKDIDVTLLPQLPGAFTPNGDGTNDLLFVKGGPFDKMLFRVYNNWGELLFETADQKTGWDGRKNGIDQPVGVYVWTLVVDMYNNRQVKKNGDVTLMR